MVCVLNKKRAHTEILEDFRFDHLASLLYLKMLSFVIDDDKKEAKELMTKVWNQDD